MIINFIRYKRTLLIIIVAILVTFLVALVSPRKQFDPSQVTAGFAGYEMEKEVPHIVVMITNHSSNYFTHPSKILPFAVDKRGTKGIVFVQPSTPKSWWSQFERPKIPSIAPGDVFRYEVRALNATNESGIFIPLWSIPAKYRLPYAVRPLWPKAWDDDSTNIVLFVNSIPPPPDNLSKTTKP